MLSGIMLLLFVAGLVIYGFLFALSRGGSARITIGPVELDAVVLSLAILLLLHEAIHAAVMRGVGARPIFGASLVGRVLPVLYVASPGHRFSRGQFLLVAAVPAVLISFLGVVLVIGPAGASFVFPLAAHLAGCAGDALITWRVARQPRGTQVEDRRDGLVFHIPTSITAQH